MEGQQRWCPHSLIHVPFDIDLIFVLGISRPWHHLQFPRALASLWVPQACVVQAASLSMGYHPRRQILYSSSTTSDLL